MPLTAADLIAPKGEIELSLFSGEDVAALDARLQSYLTEAYTKLGTLTLPAGTDLDEAARAYGYYRAYKAVHLRMSSTAATATIEGEASRTFLASQIATFADLRDENSEIWTDVLALGDEIVVERHAIEAPQGPQMIVPTW